MKKWCLNIIVLIIFILPQQSWAAQTTSQMFTANANATDSVATNGGNITSVIDPTTGALNTTINPGFLITTNSANTQTLTMSATTTTQSGSTNAIFADLLTNKYIILTNSNTLPAASSITNITGLSPTPASNPNAIAYPINDPASIVGQLTVAYVPLSSNWLLTLTHKGTTATSITIPSGSPMSNTYSLDDETGTYQATITLTFN